MRIKINKVEGKTNKKGTKQNNIFTFDKESSVKDFYDAINEKGKPYTIWNINGDWTKIGIAKINEKWGTQGRFSYTSNVDLLDS